MCPPPHETWKHHVIIEGNSFPSGGPENQSLQFRVRRQRAWQSMTPDEIASNELALNHPTNLAKFYESFGPYVDVRFVVLHRPYLETIASHIGFDAGPVNHSNVISGFMILMSRFLRRNLYQYHHQNDKNNGASSSPLSLPLPLWTIVCADKLSMKQYQSEQQLLEAREHVLTYLTEFLGWPQRFCPHCFDDWRESTKSNPEERLGNKVTKELLDHVKKLEGIWPPRREEDGLLEQQCRM